MEIIVKKGMDGDRYGTFKNSEEGRRVGRQGNWIEGWWENISDRPVYVRDKYELKRICEAESRRTGRVIIPKAFAKRASQGNGVEWSF